jgi:hypothetical protein
MRSRFHTIAIDHAKMYLRRLLDCHAVFRDLGIVAIRRIDHGDFNVPLALPARLDLKLDA